MIAEYEQFKTKNAKAYGKRCYRPRESSNERSFVTCNPLDTETGQKPTAVNYVSIKIDCLVDDARWASCYIQDEDGWIPVAIDANSLRQCGLAEGDCFDWLPIFGSKITLDRIRNHPRRFDAGEYEALLSEWQ